ncbi:hypothetical protein [Rhodomicrobium vannielii]|uniref:hypothetical protein n=1 Tax=Rhodomicrobium vannielii TaxID=1069 RepID=UPI001FEE5FD5|nr:hypothetical protein [Rhodomicrobium vannielii]
MKKIMYLTLALLAGAFTWGVGQTSAMANAAAMGVGAVQSEAAQKSDVIKVHGPWGGRGWGYGGGGWGRGPAGGVVPAGVTAAAGAEAPGGAVRAITAAGAVGVPITVGVRRIMDLPAAGAAVPIAAGASAGKRPATVSHRT